MRSVMMVLSAACLLSATAAFASSAAAVKGKDVCLVYGENCPKAKLSLPELIDRARREIQRGKAVYSDKELEILNRKLEEYQRQEELLLYHPGKS